MGNTNLEQNIQLYSIYISIKIPLLSADFINQRKAFTSIV